MNDAVIESAGMRRELATWDCGRPGPTLLVIAGIHGNEPAGIAAAQRVLARLQEHEMPIAGRITAFAGNLAALTRKIRYLDRDLNRGWSRAAIALLQQRPAGERSNEDEQQLDLLARFEDVLKTASGPVVVVDMHTSSAGGPPFLLLADTIDNRRLGLATGVPIILGMEENIDGASLEWFADRGIVGIAVEGGQHDDPATVDNHEAVLWRTLDYLRMLRPAATAGVDRESWAARLRAVVADAPPIVEIIRRRAITPDDVFRMEPGFVNFQRVAAGELLARDQKGEIRAPRAALVMLPLYQHLGEDGFFLARPVRPFWLTVATGLRALRLHVLVPLFPGVRRDPGDKKTILVNPRIARWFVPEVFHLLGFRKRRQRGDDLAFTRRVSLAENRNLGRK